MAKVRIGKFEVEEAELDRQHAQAVKRGEERLKKDPRAERASYDARTDRVIVELNNGCVFMFPPDRAQGLRGATARDLSEIEILPTGYALRWPRLDADFTVAGLLAGIFGTKAWMAEIGGKGGSVSSEAKTRAARANGRKGGRPRKVAAR